MGLIDNWWLFVLLLGGTYVLRQFRLYVLRRKAEREKENPTPPAPGPTN